MTPYPNTESIISACIDALKANSARTVEEVVDYEIQCATVEQELKLLDELGDVDLSEPMPDLSQGWSRVRRQLAYNALHAAVMRRVRVAERHR